MQELKQLWDNLSARAWSKQQRDILGGFPPP